MGLLEVVRHWTIIMKVEYSYKNTFIIEVGEEVAFNNTLIGIIK